MIWNFETLLGFAVGATAGKHHCMIEDEDEEDVYNEEECWVLQVFLGIISITIMFVQKQQSPEGLNIRQGLFI